MGPPKIEESWFCNFQFSSLYNLPNRFLLWPKEKTVKVTNVRQNTCKITFIAKFLQKFVTNGKSESGNLSGEIWLGNWFYMYFATYLIIIGFPFRHKKRPIMSDQKPDNKNTFIQLQSGQNPYISMF